MHESDPVLSFGAGRKTKRDFIVLKASQPIPPGIYSTDFEIDSLEPMRRIGPEELESDRLPSPTYSRPHFFDHRRKLAINLCVKPSGGNPGTYTGQFLLVGPGAISSVALIQTAQLKAQGGSFWPFFVGITIITILILGFRAFTELDEHSTWKDVVAKGSVVVVSTTAAGIAMFLLYEENPTWGEKGLIAVGALVAAAFTAAGLGTALAGGPDKLVSAFSNFGATRKELRRTRDAEPEAEEEAGAG